MNPTLTEIAYILDRSGSMAHMTEAAISGFNAFLQEQLDEPGDANLTLLLFDNEFLHPNLRTPLQDVRPLDATVYVPRGSTSLLDAIGLTIDGLGAKLADEPEEKRPAKVVVAIYTDGYENSSTRYSLRKINGMITHQREKYGWEFLFLAANQDAMATAAQMGIGSHMSSSVEWSGKGVSDSSAAFARKVRSMRKQVRTGEKDADFDKPMESIVREEEERE
ncbi:MAG: VWA domain-containing protein [Verrucomicrobiae bacterium]|nr:VWA domain-containing protein [Verrucomicrobiae bacterium]